MEDEDDVAAFKDFVAEAPAAAAAPEPAPPAPEPVAVAAPEPVVAAAAPTPVAAAPTPVPTPAPVVEEVVVAPSVSSAPTVGPSWGNFARVSSPLAGILSADQKKYVEKYGSTGQIPL